MAPFVVGQAGTCRVNSGMPLLYACIAPHGGGLLDPSPDSPVASCRQAMLGMGHRLAQSGAKTIVVLTPHGAYVDGALSVSFGTSAYGETDGLKVKASIDPDFAVSLAYHASALGVPVTPIVATKEAEDFPLDWGVTIPLALMAQEVTGARIVVGCPPRDIDRAQLVAIGQAVVNAAQSDNTPVALIVSADQGHGHAADGPFGFSPRSAEFDQAMADAIRENDLERLLGWDDASIEEAMPDSYWQTLSLIGVRRAVGWRSELLAYDVDHYFGLMCAEMVPNEPIR